MSPQSLFWVALLFGKTLAVCGLKLAFVRTKFPQKLWQKGLQTGSLFGYMTARVVYKTLQDSTVGKAVDCGVGGTGLKF